MYGSHLEPVPKGPFVVKTYSKTPDGAVVSRVDTPSSLVDNVSAEAKKKLKDEADKLEREIEESKRKEAEARLAKRPEEAKQEANKRKEMEEEQRKNKQEQADRDARADRYHHLRDKVARDKASPKERQEFTEEFERNQKRSNAALCAPRNEDLGAGCGACDVSPDGGGGVTPCAAASRALANHFAQDIRERRVMSLMVSQQRKAGISFEKKLNDQFGKEIIVLGAPNGGMFLINKQWINGVP